MPKDTQEQRGMDDSRHFVFVTAVCLVMAAAYVWFWSVVP